MREGHAWHGAATEGERIEQALAVTTALEFGAAIVLPVIVGFAHLRRRAKARSVSALGSA